CRLVCPYVLIFHLLCSIPHVLPLHELIPTFLLIEDILSLIILSVLPKPLLCDRLLQVLLILHRLHSYSTYVHLLTTSVSLFNTNKSSKFLNVIYYIIYI